MSLRNEIACNNFEGAVTIAKILLDNDYVVMLSREEDLIVVNYEWSLYGDKNGIVFQNADEFEIEQTRRCDECRREEEEWRKKKEE